MNSDRIISLFFSQIYAQNSTDVHGRSVTMQSISSSLKVNINTWIQS